MDRKGPDLEMSDECLMKGKSGFPYCGGCQAVRRKFTLAGKSFKMVFLASLYKSLNFTRFQHLQ